MPLNSEHTKKAQQKAFSSVVVKMVALTLLHCFFVTASDTDRHRHSYTLPLLACAQVWNKSQTSPSWSNSSDATGRTPQNWQLPGYKRQKEKENFLEAIVFTGFANTWNAVCHKIYLVSAMELQLCRIAALKEGQRTPPCYLDLSKATMSGMLNSPQTWNTLVCRAPHLVSVPSQWPSNGFEQMMLHFLGHLYQPDYSRDQY